MYYPNQVVFDYESGKPIQLSSDVWNFENYSKRNTHFIEAVEPIRSSDKREYKVSLPKSVKEAEELLFKGLISPAPCPTSHHWQCRNWKSNHDAGRCSCFKKS